MFRLQALPENVQFGPYELTHRIVAQGKLGEVYRATHRGVEGFEKPLLIKQIYEPFSRHQPFVDALVEKAAQAVKLHHANIVQVLDLGHADDRFFVTTEFVAGFDLGATLQMCRALKQSVPQELALLIGLETLKAIDYAHRRKDSQLESLNFSHQDLSPNNIMLSWEGEVKVTDFGLAAALEELPSDVSPPNPARYRYTAPEVVRGARPTPASDVFSLGLLLFEVLAGKHPYGDSDIARKAASGILVPLAERAPAIDREFCGIVDSMLHPEPEHRCRTAHDFYEPLLRLATRGGSRANARHLADWLSQLRDDFEKNDAKSDEFESRSTDDLDALRSSDVQLLTVDEPAIELRDSDIEAIHDFRNASGIWTRSALQQREFLEPPSSQVPAGIEEPIATLRRAFVDVQREGGHAYLLLGDPGAGKSFILRYALSLFSEAGSASHTAHLSDGNRAVPLGVPGEWIASAAGISATDEADLAANKLRVLASSLDLDNRELQCAMRLCGLSDEASLGPGALHDLAFSVVNKLVGKLDSLGPVLLSVDNLQYTDRPSYHFILRFLDRIPKQNVMLVMAADDPSYAGYFEHGSLTVLHHREPEERSRVIKSIFHGLELSESTLLYVATAPESLAKMVDLAAMTRTMLRRGGFADQVVQHLLSLDPGSRLATALQTLAPPEIQVLQWLAASGEPLHVMLLKDMLGLPAPQLHSVLQSLLQLGLVIYAAPGRLGLASDELAFSLRTLYDPNLVSSLHGYLAKRLVRCLRNSPSSPFRPRVQEQFARAGNADAVLEHQPIYGRYLERSGYPETALVHVQQALQQLRVSQRALPRQIVRLQLDMAKRALEVLQWDLARESVEQVYRTAGIQALPELWVEALSTDAAILLAAGNFTAALGRLEEAQMAADEAKIGDVSRSGARLFMEEVRARWCLRYGELVVADELLQSVLSTTSDADTPRVAPLLALQAQVCARRGDLEACQRAISAGRQAYDNEPSYVLRIMLATAAGEELAARDKHEDAAEELEIAYDLAHEGGHVELLLEIAELLIDAFVKAGLGSRAREYINYALDLAQRYGAHAQLDRIRLAQCYLDAAYRADSNAMISLYEALESGSENGVPSEVIRASGYLREALDRQGRGQDAEQMAEKERTARRKRGYAAP